MYKQHLTSKPMSEFNLYIGPVKLKAWLYYKDSGAYYVTTFTSVRPYKHDIEVIIQAVIRF